MSATARPVGSLALALVALVSTTGAALAQDWGQFRGPGRTGVAAGAGLLQSWDEGQPRELWRREIGGGFSAVTAVGERLYTMALEDKVYPQVEKAVAAYKASLDKSYDLTLYNENTAFATRRLGELRPNDFPGLREELIEVRLTSSAGGREYSFETSL